MCIKTRCVEKLADFAIISITNTFLNDILSKYTNNIIHPSIVKLAWTDSNHQDHTEGGALVQPVAC